MALIETNAYEIKYFVHMQDSLPWSGDEFSDESEAIEHAKEMAEDDNTVYEVTEMLERIVGSTQIEVTFKHG